jgi:murein DD-endopeptidase MepM/ murein hydrolase activator NlpD
MNREEENGMDGAAVDCGSRDNKCRSGGVSVSDGFDYPVGETGYDTQANDGDGWYNAQDFGEPNLDFGNKLHLGEDWNGEGGGDTDCGEPVYVASKGTVVYAEDAGSGWGNVIIVRHELPDGTQVESLYGHLQNMNRTNGTVERREQIGTIGKNGWPSCHLHFEMRFPNSSLWGSPGPGYSYDTTGWTDPSDFIDSNC